MQAVTRAITYNVVELTIGYVSLLQRCCYREVLCLIQIVIEKLIFLHKVIMRNSKFKDVVR